MTKWTPDVEHAVTIPSAGAHLEGLLFLPRDATALVVFVHGSGSGRLSPRNQYIAKTLQSAKFATLLFDLLTTQEDKIDNITRQYRFNIELLTERLLGATSWLRGNPQFAKLPIGYFGASTGAGAALIAASKASDVIKAVVSRGGRPDLAGTALPNVRAATLFIVGGDDEQVIVLNQQAFEKLNCVKELVIVPGATHLFEEPGKLEEVSKLATTWFKKHLI